MYLTTDKEYTSDNQDRLVEIHTQSQLAGRVGFPSSGPCSE